MEWPVSSTGVWWDGETRRSNWPQHVQCHINWPLRKHEMTIGQVNNECKGRSGNWSVCVCVCGGQWSLLLRGCQTTSPIMHIGGECAQQSTRLAISGLHPGTRLISASVSTWLCLPKWPKIAKVEIQIQIVLWSIGADMDRNSRGSEISSSSFGPETNPRTHTHTHTLCEFNWVSAWEFHNGFYWH